MNTRDLRTRILGTVAFVAAFAIGANARSDTTASGGVAAVYGAGQANSTEFLSTPDRIVSMASSGAPTGIWQTLEHGEAVECLDCIGAVAPLLYDANARNREISAWWLRKRIFGVFGPGEVYEQTINALASDPDATRRSYAANAIGEFLISSGIVAEANALTTDADPGVRAAAATGLGRLNDDGAGALTSALGDKDSGVKVAALEAAGRISTIADAGFASKLAGLVGDPDATVRTHAVLLLDAMNVKTSVAAMIALAKGDADEDVRLNACHALGTFGDSSAQPSLQYIALNDASSLVRDMATIALLRM
jgi:HEAT repeat protein